MSTDEEKLVTENMKLAYKVAWEYYNKFNFKFEFEELQSVTLLGLIEAAKTFDKDLGFKFSTYSYKIMVNNILIYFRSNKKHLNNISIYTGLSSDNDGDLEIIDTLKDNFDMDEYIEKKLDTKILQTYIKELPERYRKVMDYRLKGYTFSKIGELLGLSQPQISRDYQKAINILRYKFNIEGGGIYNE